MKIEQAGIPFHNSAVRLIVRRRKKGRRGAPAFLDAADPGGDHQESVHFRWGEKLGLPGHRHQRAVRRVVLHPAADIIRQALPRLDADFSAEAMMLTGDLNVAVVEWIVQYRVADPYLYLFKVRNVTDTFRAMTEAVMRQVVGDRTVTEVLTVGRQEIETRTEEVLRELTQQYQMGITIEQVVLQDVNPPDPVKPSWDEVNQAQQQRDRMINEAQAEYNAVIPRAAGEAQQAVLEAEGYSLNRVNRAEGESARFKMVQEAYQRAPDVTRRRLHLETMSRVMPRMGNKLFLDPDSGGVVPLLSLDGSRPTFTAPRAAPSAAPQPASVTGGTQ